jgi:ribosome-binding protein aMBF1 (putative translation factor)
MFMKICDLCRQVTGSLHSGPKGTATMEICDVCERVLMEHIAQLKQHEATTREARWTSMIEHWKRERSAADGRTST